MVSFAHTFIDFHHETELFWRIALLKCDALLSKTANRTCARCRRNLSREIPAVNVRSNSATPSRLLSSLPSTKNISVKLCGAVVVLAEAKTPDGNADHDCCSSGVARLITFGVCDSDGDDDQCQGTSNGSGVLRYCLTGI